jgi:hypothetical protein
MMRSLKIKLIFLIICTFMFKSAALWAQAGTYKYRSDIQKIDSGRIYKIELSPELIAKSLSSLNDIHVFDNTGKSVAYALGSNLSAGSQNSFIEFPLVNPNPEPDTTTSYIAENTNRLSIDQLWIGMKNTSVNRTVNLSGSDDLKTWFAIKEDIQLQDAGYSDKPDYEQSFSFPTSNYHYFRIQVNGKNKTSVKVLRSGIYITNSNKPEFTALPPVKFNSKDTAKKTSVFIRLDEPYQVNKLHLNITDPKYYSRRVVVYTSNEKFTDVSNQICDTTISSSGTQDITLIAKTRYIRVDIFNGDDNPLKIKAITAWQLKQYIISYLAGGHDYYVFTGDPSANKADYDLSFLKFCSIDQLPVIATLAVYKNKTPATGKPVVRRDYTLFIWVSMIAVLILLGFLTLKMTREIK